MKPSSARPRPRRVGRSEPLKWRVSDAMWERLEPILTDPPRRFRYPGRARYSPRQCLEGILYVLYTDTPWLQVQLAEAERLDWSRVIVDASLIDAKKGATRSRARSGAGLVAATTSP